MLAESNERSLPAPGAKEAAGKPTAPAPVSSTWSSLRDSSHDAETKPVRTSTPVKAALPRKSPSTKPSSMSAPLSPAGPAYRFTPAEEKLLSHRAFFEAAVLGTAASDAAVAAGPAASRPKAKVPGGLRNGKVAATKADDDLDRDIIVCVRARPLLPHELATGHYASVVVPSSTETETPSWSSKVQLHSIEQKIDGRPSLLTKAFDVDRAFGPDVSNDAIYEAVARPLISLAVGGGVGSLFAYGQTGSGKTFTMTAMEQFIARDLFVVARNYRQQTKNGAADDDPTAGFQVNVCFFELIGSNARDLLSPDAAAPVQILEDVFGRIQVKNAVESTIATSAELLSIIERGAATRRTEGTAKNATSSRSHAVCRIRITDLTRPEAEDGVLYLLDLAGSEGSADTRFHDKERIAESVEINKSLATLKDCIRNRAIAATSSKHVHIPYRNSRLTLLLKEAFDLGSARPTQTVVIAALSASILDTTQSLNTLRYTAPLKVSTPAHRPEQEDEKNPATWTNARVRAWLARHPLARGRVDADVLCPTESGRQLLRLPEPVFLARCCDKVRNAGGGMEPKAAKAMYDSLWKDMIDARTKVRKTAMRETKTRMREAAKKDEAETQARWDEIWRAGD
ncbi:P-loop containing nucleoside triphosphate hydrolase protein [Zopfochytrium polystomum]|nr:P-loop containing nucleoside triphosphate hydrolase protein [Zopfochytrium polystomum]